MVPAIVSLILTSLTIGAQSHPYASNGITLDPRDSATSPPANSHPVIKANITNQNGSDISHAFRVMVYNPPRIDTTTDLNSRSNDAPFGTSVNVCHTRQQAIFVSSSCNRRAAHGAPGSMQAYSMICRDSDSPSTQGRGLFYETGKCADDEICVDERGPGKRISNEAYCVKKSRFRWVGDPKGNTMNLGNKNVNLAVSESDGKTPLEMKSLEVNAVDASGSKAGYQAIQEGICMACVAMCTEELPSEVAVVTTTATAKLPFVIHSIVLGILWLLFF